MNALADDSALWRGEPIIDQTALSGIFEIELTADERTAFDQSAAAVRELVDKLP